MLQLKPSEVPSKETIKEMEPSKDQIKLKITLKPPTLVHYKNKQQQSQETTINTRNQNQHSEQLRGDNKTKPALEQATTKTTSKPKQNQTTKQDSTTKPDLTVQARPDEGTNTEAKAKQPRKTKPRVVETSDIRLFIANQKLEREKWQRESFIVENSSPSNNIVSATPQCSSVPLQTSAPSTVSQISWDIPDLSTRTQGAQASSAINEKY